MKKFMIILFFLVTLVCIFIFVQVKLNDKKSENKNQIIKSVIIKDQEPENIPTGPLMKDEDNNVAGISLNSKKEELLKVFGKPIQNEKSEIVHYEDIGTAYNESWIYNDLRIVFTIRVDAKSNLPIQDDYGYWVDKIYISGGNYKTRRGIKIGDSIEKVIEKYGNDENSSMQPNKEMESIKEAPNSVKTKEYSNDYFYIKFGFTNGKVSYIEVGRVYLG